MNTTRSSKGRATPGPWGIEYVGDKVVGFQTERPTIALVGDYRIVMEDARGYDLHEEDKDDARLIAAAPELFEALKGALVISELCRPWPDEFGPEVRDALDKRFEAIRAALRKASEG